MEKGIHRHLDYWIVAALFGIVAGVSWASLKEPLAALEAGRMVLGIPFILLAPGWVATTLLFHGKPLSLGERVVIALGLSLMLWYPAGFLNVLLIEGQTNIYAPHLMGDLGMLGAIMAGMMMIGMVRRARNPVEPIPWQWPSKKAMVAALPWVALGALALYLRTKNLTVPNMNQDEFEIGYRAYDLVDGIQAGRRAYFLSATDHSPLGFYIWHFLYQFLSPWGYETLKEWMLRIPNVLMGMLMAGVTGRLAWDLFKSRAVAFGAVAFLAVDQYSIFASRLGIPQDLSYLAVFMTLAVWGVARFLSFQGRGRLIVAALFLGGALLIKFTAVLMVPVVLAMFAAKRGIAFLKSRTMAGYMAGTAAVFSPVVVFNLATYWNERYLDVPFSKIARLFGVEVLSVMPAEGGLYSGDVPNPVQALYELMLMLIDQWNLFFFAAIVTACLLAVAGLIRERERRWERGTLLLWIAIAVLFFITNGFRVYYAAFLSVPAVILVASEGWARRKAFWIVTVPLLAYMTFYSTQTHVMNGRWEAHGERGRLGYEVVKPAPWERPYAVSTVSFLSDRGFDELERWAQTNVGPEDFLVIDEDIQDLLLRRYLGIGDEVKRYTLGEGYKDRYRWMREREFLENSPVSEGDGETYRIVLPQNKRDTEGQELMNGNGKPGFIIYKEPRQ